MMLGFSGFRNLLTKITFNVYYGVIKGSFFSQKLKIHVTITTNRLLRSLQEYEADCIFIREEKNNFLPYLCEISEAIDNIKSVKVSSEPQFSSFSPNTIVMISPLAEINMDNIQEASDDISNLLNANLTIYILEKSQIVESEKQNFNVSGIINDPKPNFKKVNFTLISKAGINDESYYSQLNCSIIDIIDNNYTLNCQGDKNVNYDLQKAMATIDYELLILNFEDYENSNVGLNNKSSKTSIYNIFRNNITKLMAFIIIPIAIAIICAILRIN